MNVTVTNTCICAYCEDCDVVFWAADGDCPACDATGEEIHCLGCWQDMHDELSYVLSQWEYFTERNFIISGQDMGWRRRSGYKIVEGDCSASEFIDVIAPLRSEWTQTWTLSEDGSTLTVTQSHHDSMGETYTLLPLTADSLKGSGAEDDYLSDILDTRAEEIIREAAYSRYCHSDAGPFDYRDAEDVRQHMGFESVDEVYAMAERVAHAEWQDDRLRSICYNDIVEGLRY